VVKVIWQKAGSPP